MLDFSISNSNLSRAQDPATEEVPFLEYFEDFLLFTGNSEEHLMLQGINSLPQSIDTLKANALELSEKLLLCRENTPYPLVIP